jgi:surface polysaccharide O-acyltransferase-like enzyme
MGQVEYPAKAKTNLKDATNQIGLRVLAVLLLLYFHSAAIFMLANSASLHQNDQSSHAMSCFIKFFHQWHMPLFFLLSGLALLLRCHFAHQVSMCRSDLIGC